MYREIDFSFRSTLNFGENMGTLIRAIHLKTPNPRIIAEAADIIDRGGIIVYPTDTIYGIGVDLFNKKAIERVLALKKVSKHKQLSFICRDLKNIARWAIVPDHAYRVMRRVLPGPYTFVLRATREIPKRMLSKQKTIGLRIPDCDVPHALVDALGRPILSTSVPQGEDGYFSDPHEIAQMLGHEIDLILDAGVMFNQPSTVVDFSGDEPEILREGAGDMDALYY